ncbi:MAG TPA: acetyl-CoA carboxylase carboxyl transferase subunit alpha, partial [Bacillota bacterium]|nr:acetyl-CoA carboxylase carboxyl transferase subunit alpha [Bacillota bacterium]
VISPEGAAALLWKDSSLAQRAAESMQITSYDLKKLGVIDSIIPEPLGGAHRNMKKQAENVKMTIESSLAELTALSSEELLERRWEKYKKIGEFREL